jgi:NTP pyrophosphatase (non-canonical NTP hydrolase)
MEINKYQKEASRTCAKIDGAILDDLHMVLGMQTEAAEIADVYKKTIAYKKPLDFVNIKEELGDIMWYIANLCNMNGWDLRDIMQTNIDKLKTRYPDKFSEEEALNRNLKKERGVLEGVTTSSLNEHVRFSLDNQSHT